MNWIDCYFVFRNSVSRKYQAPVRQQRILEPKAPPSSYICHRCGDTGICFKIHFIDSIESIIKIILLVNFIGHYINVCPTNGNPDFDFQKPKKATGIPRSFLKQVEVWLRTWFYYYYFY